MGESVSLPDLAAVDALAARLAPELRQGDVVALYGDLGAGKTTFARALLRAMGVTGDVPSPTFTLLQTYEAGGLPIAHYDLYRLKSADELEELGWDDALADGITLIEWPERAGDCLPVHSHKMRFAIAEDGSRVCEVGWVD